MTLHSDTPMIAEPNAEFQPRSGTGGHPDGSQGPAAKEVFDKYYARLVRLVSGRQCFALRPRFDGEDVVQSTLRTFFLRIRTGKLSVDPGEDLWTILSLIALRKLAAQARKNLAVRRSVCRESQFPQDGGDPIELIEGVDDEAELKLEMREELEYIIALLPLRYRDIVVMRLEGRAVAEIAEQIGCSERTVLRALERCCELATERHERD